MSSNGFAADWLALREPFDSAARDRDLAQRFAAALEQQSLRHKKPLKKLVDLGAGTGANFRFLAPLIGGNQDWLLIDHDPLLLAAQSEAIRSWAADAGWHCEANDGGISVHADTGCWRLHGQSLDLASALETLDLSTVDGVTTTAFLDLVSAPWLTRLAKWLATEHCPLLATLTVDGRRVWQPALDSDAVIDRTFRNHQASDKGFGAAVGNTAAHYLAERLAEFGYATAIACSDWQIGAEHPEMLMQMASEAAEVATAVAATDASTANAVVDWLNARSARIASGNAALTVGHCDLLGLARRI
jgi:hypothetical protein